MAKAQIFFSNFPSSVFSSRDPCWCFCFLFTGWNMAQKGWMSPLSGKTWRGDHRIRTSCSFSSQSSRRKVDFSVPLSTSRKTKPGLGRTKWWVLPPRELTIALPGYGTAGVGLVFPGLTQRKTATLFVNCSVGFDIWTWNVDRFYRSQMYREQCRYFRQWHSDGNRFFFHRGIGYRSHGTSYSSATGRL